MRVIVGREGESEWAQKAAELNKTMKPMYDRLALKALANGETPTHFGRVATQCLQRCDARRLRTPQANSPAIIAQMFSHVYDTTTMLCMGIIRGNGVLPRTMLPFPFRAFDPKYAQYDAMRLTFATTGSKAESLRTSSVVFRTILFFCCRRELAYPVQRGVIVGVSLPCPSGRCRTHVTAGELWKKLTPARQHLPS